MKLFRNWQNDGWGSRFAKTPVLVKGFLSLLSSLFLKLPQPSSGRAKPGFRSALAHQWQPIIAWAFVPGSTGEGIGPKNFYFFKNRAMMDCH
jgi:hypothetical protein